MNKTEQNNCAVKDAAEAPFLMYQLLSKLDAKDNVESGREIYRMQKDENVLNLIDWLNREARLRSRIKKDSNCHNNTWGQKVLPPSLCVSKSIAAMKIKLTWCVKDPKMFILVTITCQL